MSNWQIPDKLVPLKELNLDHYKRILLEAVCCPLVAISGFVFQEEEPRHCSSAGVHYATVFCGSYGTVFPVHQDNG